MAQLFTPFPMVSTMVQPISTIISASAIQPTIFNPYIIPPLIPPLFNTSIIGNTVVPTIDFYPPISVYPSVISYQDVNNDHDLKKRVVEYFYDKLLNNWLKFHYADLYTFFNVSGGKVNLVKNVKDSENNTKNDKHDNDIKYEFLVDKYLRKKDMLTLLSKFRKMNNLNWWDLKEHAEKVRLYVHHKVKQLIKEEIMK